MNSTREPWNDRDYVACPTDEDIVGSPDCLAAFGLPNGPELGLGSSGQNAIG